MFIYQKNNDLENYIYYNYIFRFNSGANSSKIYIPKTTISSYNSFVCFAYNLGASGIEYSIDCFTIQINYNFDTIKLAYIKDQIIQYHVKFQGENLVIANNYSQQENIYYLYICMIPIFVQSI